MVEVVLREDSRARLSSFLARGHAGWADSGSDVVCAAVSALLQAAWLGLTEHAGVDVDGSRRNAGDLELRWPAAVRERDDVRAIVTTVALSLERIAIDYPQHVRVRRETDRE
ncbi:MAG TPA: ribosomal-processing cysteine protease Prp [Candidatus Acidoferrales bacterium]|nr:ribosomal-processing cysteine protease Prp [Candidatus Acidoferrales bacterium]